MKLTLVMASAAILLLCSGRMLAQELKEKDFVFQPTIFTESEMKEMWTKFSNDEDWKALVAQTKEKGFTRILNKEAAWGFKGTLTDDKGEKKNVVFCAFDFVNSKDVSQGCSMIWKIVGKESYKAYLVFPPGETDVNKKFEKAQEWYAEKGQVKKANSWGTRFRACVQRGVPVPGIETELSNNRSRVNVGGATYTITCQTQCLASAIACSTLASVTALATAGIIAASAGTLTIPALITAGGFGAAVLISCSATGCGTCIFMCALAAF